MKSLYATAWLCALTAILFCVSACSRGPGRRGDTALAELDRRLTAMEQSQKTIETALASLQAIATGQAPARAGVDAAGEARLRALVQAEVARRIEEQIGSREDIDGIFREAVEEQAAALEQRQKSARQEQREQMRKQWEERRREFEQRQWDSIQQDLKLTDDQLARMKTASDEVRKGIEEAMAGMRGQNGDLEQVRRQSAALRENYEKQLAGFLSAEQIEAYRNRPMSLLRMMDIAEGVGRLFEGRGPGQASDAR